MGGRVITFFGSLNDTCPVAMLASFRRFAQGVYMMVTLSFLLPGNRMSPILALLLPHHLYFRGCSHLHIRLFLLGQGSLGPPPPTARTFDRVRLSQLRAVLHQVLRQCVPLLPRRHA